MAIIVEDGTGSNPNANSYDSEANIIQYAADRGITLDPTPAVIEPNIIKAMDYIESQDFKGERTNGRDQPLEWPREDVYIGDDEIDDDEIPKELKCALAEAVIAIQVDRTDFFPTYGDDQLVIEEQVDVMRTKFSDDTFITGTPTVQKVENCLADLVDGFSDGVNIGTLRV